MAFITRASAGILSPASSIMISPVTSSVASISTQAPSRFTCTFETVKSFSASMAFSLFSSCANPISAFTSTQAKITMASITLSCVTIEYTSETMPTKISRSIIMF